MEGIKIELSERIKKLPPYLFAELDRKKKEAKEKGVDLIDFGVGDPDIPTWRNIIDRLSKAAENPENHRYPSYEGLLKFRSAVASWYKRRFDVDLDPKTEVLTLIGSKEGIAHTPLAFINPKDIVLVPDPSYPVYQAATTLADGNIYYFPLLEEKNFLPDLSKIPENIAKSAKIMFLNFPNNPTTAVANKKFFEEVVDFAKTYNIIICHDAAYSEVCFDGFLSPSFLEVKGAKDVGVEFHSLSKTYNMTGWRIGFVCGNPEIIEGLKKVKTNVDSGVFQAIQFAAVEALTGDQTSIIVMRRTYKERRDILVNGLKKLGFSLNKPLATFYVWVKVPKNFDSMSFSEFLLTNAGIVVTPGIGFGKNGEGYVRFALTVKKERIEEAIERLEKIL